MKFVFRFLLIVFCVFYSSKVKADFLTLDSHIDIPFDYMTNPEHDPGNKTDMQVDFQKMLEGNLDGGFFIVYVGQSELDKNGFQAAKKKAIIKFKFFFIILLFIIVFKYNYNNLLVIPYY